MCKTFGLLVEFRMNCLKQRPIHQCLDFIQYMNLTTSIKNFKSQNKPQIFLSVKVIGVCFKKAFGLKIVLVHACMIMPLASWKNTHTHTRTLSLSRSLFTHTHTHYAYRKELRAKQ